MNSTILLSFALKMAPYVRQEVEALGFKISHERLTSIELEGTMDDCATLNFHLRCVNKVLFHLKYFHAGNANELYKEAIKIEWENFLKEDGYFTVSSVIDQPGMDTPLFANVKLKDAIADRFRNKFNQRPDSGSDRSKAAIFLFWKNDTADVYLDTSGETLHKHGYRYYPYKAPMQESLASAVVMASGWNLNSSFVNPMCGSGTLAIEAALMATNQPPGLLRDNYSFMHYKNFNADHFQELKRNARKLRKDEIDFKIVASDYSEEALKAAEYNATQAGVDHLIDFQVCDFAETAMPQTPGVVLINPPYGERMGDLEELQPLYKSIGDYFKKSCAGYTGGVFSGNIELAKTIGLKPKRKIEFFSAQLPCKLFLFELYSGSKRIVQSD